MRLTDDERAVLDGRDGRAQQKAMELLVRYGEALGAERLVETRNVCGTWGVATPIMRDLAASGGGIDKLYSEFNLDSDEVVPTPHAAVFTCQLIHGIDTKHADVMGTPADLVEFQKEGEKHFGSRGVQMMATCTPYQVGNVPVMGEHCAWMESSAVVYCNGVLGARTNTEGRESTGAASITGRIPYWGYHIPENRRGNTLVEVECEVESMMDWGLLGYHVGEIVQDEIPVITGIKHTPNLIRLKHFGAAAASSGGIEMYHIPGVTPEAPSVEVAFGGNKAQLSLKFGAAERRSAYEKLNSGASDRNVDFVMLGCPHNSLEQVWLASRLLEGKRVHENTQLWIFTPRAVAEMAERNGYTKIIRDAGAHLLSDTCPAISRAMPKNTRVVATDSAKQTHYLPAITGVQTWFGSLEDCISAALTSKWTAGLS
jgi:predicted aconitase